MAQREMPLLGEVKKGQMEPAPEGLIRSCKSELDAIKLCISMAGHTYDTVCDELGIDNGHWSRIINGHAHFPTKKRVALMRFCENYAPVQYELMALGLPQVEENEEQKEIRELESRLNELRGKSVAA